MKNIKVIRNDFNLENRKQIINVEFKKDLKVWTLTERNSNKASRYSGHSKFVFIGNDINTNENLYVLQALPKVYEKGNKTNIKSMKVVGEL